MKELTKHEKMALGEAAARYLSDPVLTDIFNTIREEAISDAELPEKRDEAVALIIAVRKIRDELHSFVTTGKRAAKQPD